MISVDTNILVRAYLGDDLNQTIKSQNILLTASRENNLFISSYALLEFVWVLKTKKLSRKDIYEAIINLTDSAGVVVGQREVVLAAAEMFIKGNADFGDYMIIQEGEKKGAQQICTFDKMILTEYERSTLP